MPLARRVSYSIMILSFWTTMSGCPTPPGTVSGRADDAAPGELIEWPGSQIDPTGEDTAGFNQIASADMNGDGLVDLVTAAYESQPIQVHLQQRATDGTISFRSFSVAGSGPIVRVSELKIADIDQDGNPDIIISILDNGFVVADECATQQGTIIILFAPPDPSDNLEWEEFNLTLNFRCALVDGTATAFRALGFDGNNLNYASMDVGDVNDDGFPDILAAFNGCEDESIPTKQVELWINPADDSIRQNQTLLGTADLDDDGDGQIDGCEPVVDSSWQKVLLQIDFVDITSVRFSDVDLDSDLDVVALRPTSRTFDITWQANPLVPSGIVAVDFWTGERLRPIGESDAGLNVLEIGDLDGDGFNDVLALGRSDRLLRWFRRPLDPAAQNFPWNVFNMVQYSTLTPTAMDIADIDADGQLDVIAAAGGSLRWFTPLGVSPFEAWSEQAVVDDALIGNNSETVGDTPFFPINSVHAVDIDGDGRLDITATFDREGQDNDILVWFRNTEIELE